MTTVLAPTRRTFVRAAAWTTPVVMVVAASPAFATSHEPPIIIEGGYKGAIKCPGRSNPNEFSYVFEFEFSAEPDSVTATSVKVNDVVFAIAKTIIEGTTVFIVTTSSDTSANASGSGVINYVSNGVTQVPFPFAYSGTKANPNFCRTI